MAGLITLIEGSSTAPEVVKQVKDQVRPGEKVLVVLDSNHTYAHVAEELEAYAPLVTPGSYILATDGIMRDLTDVPRGNPDWKKNNPANAAEDFVGRNQQFIIEEPQWLFEERHCKAMLRIGRAPGSSACFEAGEHAASISKA